MQTAFQILSKNKSDGLHLQLRGDFDGNSAYELINKLKENEKIRQIFINTEGINQVHPFGSSIFENHIPLLNKNGKRLIFTGTKKNALLN